MLYSLIQVHLSVHYLRFQKRGKSEHERLPALNAEQELPVVTIQLPIYNELYVVERLIEAVSEFDYPKDKLEIQVLDDSTDETVDIIAKKVAEIAAEKGLDIQHVRRPERKGFKAGALQYGLKIAKGEFIAIFDADFVPRKDFLRNTIPHFYLDDQIGLVQTRWEHLNKDYSLLTKLQAFGLDAHFSVEQQGRFAGGYFLNFNGTAGVWRRTCIDDAGGWEHDTLTEDLDLSYRAQLKGWKIKFMENLGSPAELPWAMTAIKSQQFRWTKGAAEVARKNLWKVLRAKLPFGLKVHAFFHLMNSSIFVCVLMTAILSVPMILLKDSDPNLEAFFKYASLFLLSMLGLVTFYWTSRTNRETDGLGSRASNFLVTFPLFLALSMGMSLHNAIATIEGYLGVKSPFIRTPKFNVDDLKDNWRDRTKYLTRSISPVTIMEGLFTLYFIAGIALGIYHQEYGMLPFHIMLTLGYGAIFYFSVRHTMAAA
ncbi:MAG: glycosyltransferase [Bacteroidota bacterium]